MTAHETMPAPSHTAVLLYGDLAAGRKTAATLRRHILASRDACVFRFGPDGDPTERTRGSTGAASVDKTRSDDPLADIPGATVARTGTDQAFLEEVRAMDARIQRVPGVDPARLLATFHDMGGVIALWRDYERRTGTTFDTVLLLRSDLALYGPIDVRPSRGTVHVPAGRGLDNETGAPLVGQRTVHPFISAETGDLIPDSASLSFQHQIMALHRDDIVLLEEIHDRARDCLERGVPASYETILYLLLKTRGHLKPIHHREWLYGQRYNDDPLPDAQAADPALLCKGNAPEQKPKKRVAVLLFGLLRDYQTTAGSLLRHVVAPNDASLFYFGPAQSDRPHRSNMGVYDEQGFFVSNPKGNFEDLDAVETADIFETYGDALKRAEFHDVDQGVFQEVASEIYRREDWLFMLSPHRLLSMFYNISGAVDLLRQYESEVGFAFDEVIITRADLAFYAPVNAVVSPGEMHIAGGEGFDRNGNPHRGNAPAYFYKNAATGDYVAGGRVHFFNDQIFLMTRDDLRYFYGLYDRLIEGFKAKVPASPETIFHLFLAEQAGLKIIDHPEWRHEIFRGGDLVMQNVTDIPEIVHIDPRNPKAARRLMAERRSDEDAPRRAAAGPSSDEAFPSTALLQELALGASRPGFWSKVRARHLLRRARSRRRRGDLASAERLYARVLQLAPGNRREWIQYGHVLKDQGHVAAGLAAYEMALTLEPSDADAQHHRQAVRHSL